MKKKLSQKEMAELYMKNQEYQRTYSQKPEIKAKRNAYNKKIYQAMRAAYLASLKVKASK